MQAEGAGRGSLARPSPLLRFEDETGQDKTRRDQTRDEMTQTSTTTTHDGGGDEVRRMRERGTGKIDR